MIRNVSDGIPLHLAARQIDPDLSTNALRRALNNLGLLDRLPDGRRTVSPALVELFSRCRRESGYLHRRGVSKEELLAAAEKMVAG